MRAFLVLVLLLTAVPAWSWPHHADNFLGKPLVQPATYTGADGYIWKYVEATGRYTLGTITAGMLPAHATTHQDTGSDEISVTGLSGLLADPQLIEIAESGVLTGTRKRVDVAGYHFDSVVTAGGVNLYLATDSVTPSAIAANAVGSSELADNAVDTAAITDTAVTLPKIQNAVASSKLLGSGSSGAGAAYAELTLGTNLSMAGTTLNAAAGTIAVQDGATVVDAVAGTLIFEGPQFIGTSGPAGSASIALATGGVTADSLGAGAVTYPKIQNVADARLLGNASGAPAAPSEISASGGLTLSGGALTWDGFALRDGATSIDTALKTIILSGAQFGTSGSAGVRQIFIDTGGVTVDSLGAGAVTYPKIQNVADARLLGNASGAPAAPSEISASGGLTLASGALSWNGSTLFDGATSIDTALKTIIMNGEQFETSGSAGTRQIFLATGGVTVDALASNSVSSAKIVDGTITDSDVAAANKDGAQGTASMRTIAGTPVALGTAAAIGSGQTAAAYDHVHAAPSVTVNGTAHGATTTLVVNGDGTSSTTGGTTNVTIGQLPMAAVTATVSRTSGDVCLFTADALCLQSTLSTTATKILRNVSVSPDKSVSGPAINGRDQSGAFAADTWIYGFVIAKDDPAAAPAGLWSLSKTAPTLPAGYNWKCLVSIANTGNSGVFRGFVQDSSRTVLYTLVFAQCIALNGGSAPTTTEIPLNTGTSKLVPPDSRSVHLWGGITPNAIGDRFCLGVDSAAANPSDLNFVIDSPSATVGAWGSITMPTTTNQSVYYRLTNGSAVAYLYVTGFRW